jgi:hypothetical protein
MIGFFNTPVKDRDKYASTRGFFRQPRYDAITKAILDKK